MKRGITLIELVVAMAIFMIVATIAIGGFVTITRMKALTSTMKESQQKVRIAMEMMSRLSRQAEKVSATSTSVDLYFNVSNPTYLKATRFYLNPTGDPNEADLFMADCASFASNACTTWGTGTNLTDGTFVISTIGSGFTKTGEVPPRLTIVLNGRISGVAPNHPYFSDSLNINTAVILENVR